MIPQVALTVTRLLCFDPGKTTGVATLIVTPGLLRIETDTLSYLFETYSAQDSEKLTRYLTIPVDKVIIEKVRTFHASVDQSGVVMMGYLQGALATLAPKNPEVLFQTPSVKEVSKKWPIGKVIMDALKVSKASEHVKDAVAHGVYYLVKNGDIPIDGLTDGVTDINLLVHGVEHKCIITQAGSKGGKVK